MHSRYSRQFSVGYDFVNDPKLSGTQLTCSDDIKDSNLLKVKSVDVVGDYTISAKLIGETEFQPIFVGTGTVDTEIDISLYDRIKLDSTSGLTAGSLAISSFQTYGNVTNNYPEGSATFGNQVIANDLLTQILNETIRDLDCSQNPVIFNLDVNGVSLIYDVDLPLDTKKIVIRHRNQGNVEFAFDAGLTTYFTIPKGCSYSDDKLCLNNLTLYLRSDKVGVVEIIAWT